MKLSELVELASEFAEDWGEFLVCIDTTNLNRPFTTNNVKATFDVENGTVELSPVP